MPIPEIKTIICGTDGSPDAQNAVAHTAHLARQLSAHVVLVHAIGLLEHMPIEQDHPEYTGGDRASELLTTTWSEPLRDLGVTHTCLAEEGPPLFALPRIADQVNADLIVIASHGEGIAAVLPLGSTAHGMVQLATIPLLIIPGQTRTSEFPDVLR